MIYGVMTKTNENTWQEIKLLNGKLGAGNVEVPRFARVRFILSAREEDDATS